MAAGSHRRSLRREIRSVQRGLGELGREVGGNVDWFELDATASTFDNLYDEEAGEGLIFRAPRTMRSVWIRFLPPARVQDETGLYTLNRLSLRFPADQMQKAGLTSPMDPDLHFTDRFHYNGFLYRVESYEPKGWLHGTYLMVDIAGRQLKIDEMTMDQKQWWESGSPAHLPGQALPWPDQPLDPSLPDPPDGTG